MQIVQANKKGLELAVKFLKAGKAVVYPTDTSYGLGVDATNAKAVRRLYKIKQRKFNQPVHVIVQNFAAVKKLAMVDTAAERVMKRFWPGPVTVIFDLSPHLSPRQGRGVRALSAGTGTIGVRMPNNKIALALVKKLNRPITTPSANPPDSLGGYDSYSIQESYRQFVDKKHQPDLFLDAGKLPRRRPSTIVRIENGKIKILRKGPITKIQIKRILKK